MNDNDRRDWINNDESLYLWWRNSKDGRNMRAFIKANRAEITAYINKKLGRA
jgi:hypothetical protein